MRELSKNLLNVCFLCRIETSNGINQQESGKLKTVPDVKEAVLVKEGDFTYSGPNGPIHVHYIADETGFHPTGDHLPKV